MALVPSNSWTSGGSPASRVIFSSRFIAMRYVSLLVTTVRVHICPPPRDHEHSRAFEPTRRVIWRSCSAATGRAALRQSAARGAISDGWKMFWERIARWQRLRRPRQPSKRLWSSQTLEMEAVGHPPPHKEVDGFRESHGS